MFPISFAVSVRRNLLVCYINTRNLFVRASKMSIDKRLFFENLKA